MNLGGDTRAVSSLIGALLLFGFLIVFISVWQVQVIPEENAEVEYQHYQDVQDDMLNLRTAYINAAESGRMRSVTVQLGTSFPVRVLFVNAPPSTGALRTETVANGTIEADGVSVSSVCGTGSSTQTRAIKYTPRYNHFNENEAPPLVYDNTVLYAPTGDNESVVLGEQRLIQGTSINLHPIDEELARTGGETTTVEFSGAETGTTEVEGTVNITLPTRLSDDKWEQLLSDQEYVDRTEQVDTERVKIVLSDRTWEVSCAAVGSKSTPETDPVTADEQGAGQGGTTEWSESDEKETFSVANGRWTEIDCTDQMLLSNAEPASKPSGDDLSGEVIRLTGAFNDSGGETYTVDVKLARASDGSFNTREVIVYDGNGNSASATLTAGAAAAIYDNGETDILDTANYESPDTGSGSFSDYLNRIQRLDDDAPVRWQTSRMTGRVAVTLTCDSPPSPPASGVETVDGSTPGSERSSLLFDIQVATGTQKTVTNFTITAPGNQNSGVTGVDEIKRQPDPEVELTPGNTSGNNQTGDASGGKFRFGSANTHTLDTNAVFEDGAVLNVEMGVLKKGSNTAKLTYDIASSQSNADIVVTFGFQDGTVHKVYLRVTNVNT